MQSAAGARAAFEDAPNVSVVEIPINDGWARDWGPSVSPPHLQQPCILQAVILGLCLVRLPLGSRHMIAVQDWLAEAVLQACNLTSNLRLACLTASFPLMFVSCSQPVHTAHVRMGMSSCSCHRQHNPCDWCCTDIDDVCLQCVVKDDKATGKRVVAGTHWDFDSYGGTIKKQLGMPTQASHPDSAISNFMCARSTVCKLGPNKLGIPVLTCTPQQLMQIVSKQASCTCSRRHQLTVLS